MKYLLILALGLVTMTSCSNNGGESGAVDDGKHAEDADTLKKLQPATDTARGEDRVDTERRDSVNR